MQTESTKKRGKWSVELVLVIALPLVAVVAGIATLIIANQSGFTVQQEVSVDRFGRDKPAP